MLSTAMLVLTATTARATCNNTETSNLPGATASMYGWTTWNASNRFLKLEVVAESGMSTDYCADSWFDWTFQFDDEDLG